MSSRFPKATQTRARLAGAITMRTRQAGGARWQPAALSRLGSGERACRGAAEARPAGPSDQARASQSPTGSQPAACQVTDPARVALCGNRTPQAGQPGGDGFGQPPWPPGPSSGNRLLRTPPSKPVSPADPVRSARRVLGSVTGRAAQGRRSRMAAKMSATTAARGCTP